MICAPALEADATSTPTKIASPGLRRLLPLNRFTVTGPTARDTLSLQHELDQVAPFLLSVSKIPLTVFGPDDRNISEFEFGETLLEVLLCRVRRLITTTTKEVTLTKHVTGHSVPALHNRNFDWPEIFVSC
jgi:hypothetical protein